MTPEQISEGLIKWLDEGAEGWLSIQGALDVREGQELKNINLLVIAMPETNADYFDGAKEMTGDAGDTPPAVARRGNPKSNQEGV